MKHCTVVFLVGLDHELPADPRVGYFGTGEPPIIGCNKLVCFKCRALVKHADARAIMQAYPPPREDLEELYASADPAGSPLLDGSPMNARSRTYFCRCDWYSVRLGLARSLNFLEQDWACGGHPE